MGTSAADHRVKHLIGTLGLREAFAEDEGIADLGCCVQGCNGRVRVNPLDNRAVCDTCDLDETAVQFLERIRDAKRSPAAQTELTVRAAEEGGNVRQLFPRETAPAASTNAPDAPIRDVELTPKEEHRRTVGETLIIALLALAFLGVGLLAAAMSGFANYLAFGAMVDDPLQSRIWAWTGIIASICSFGGFTFVYWHGAGGRMKEAVRAAVFALAGAATSLVGTQMYMANTEQARLAEVQAATGRVPLIEAQISDWRGELAGIPTTVRSVEGLEAYIAEVERVGRTHQKPYRDALDELGQARRRDDLTRRIEGARADMVALAPLVSEAARTERPVALGWFFATMLEVFSSQGTSIGFVALMILAGRRPRGP